MSIKRNVEPCWESCFTIDGFDHKEEVDNHFLLREVTLVRRRMSNNRQAWSWEEAIVCKKYNHKISLFWTLSATQYVVSEKLRNPISFKLSCFSLKKSSQNRCPARNGSAVLSRIAWMWWQPAPLAAVLVTSRLFSWTAAPPPALASLASSFFSSYCPLQYSILKPSGGARRSWLWAGGRCSVQQYCHAPVCTWTKWYQVAYKKYLATSIQIGTSWDLPSDLM